MNAISGTAVVFRVKMDITVHVVAIVVVRTVSNVQTSITTVTDANLDIGEPIVRRHVAVAV